MASLLVWLASSTLVACQAPESLPSALLIQGRAPLNVNHEDDSIPVNVRILALSSRNNFDQEVRDFDALWREPAARLGDELLASPQEATVYPSGEFAGATRLAFASELPEQTAFVAVLALFHTQKYETERVRYQVIPVAQLENTIFMLTEARIEVRALHEQQQQQ